MPVLIADSDPVESAPVESAQVESAQVVSDPADAAAEGESEEQKHSA